MLNRSQTTSWIRSIVTWATSTLWEDILEHVLRELRCHRPPGQRGKSDHSSERAFELADVGGDAAGDEGEQLRVGDVDAVGLHLLPQDCDTGLEVGWLDVRDQPPLEPRAQPRLERCDSRGGRSMDMTICEPDS